MIIDELIALVFSFFGILIEGIAGFFTLIINLFALLIEFILALFITDFSMGRVKGYKRKKTENADSNIPESFLDSRWLMPVLVVTGVVGYFAFQNLSTRNITFIADDGHSLPFASVVVYKGDKPNHRRTLNDGSLKISRFGIDKIVLNDKRYKAQTWRDDEFEEILTVKRSFIGKSVDALAHKFLQKIKKDTD
jgi:hypothetical protein